MLGTRVAISDTARDHGELVIDSELSLAAHVTAVFRFGYNQLRQLRPVVRSARCPCMPPRRSSRRSSRVVWTTATHCCTASAMDYFVASIQCKTLPSAWSQAFIVVTTSHQCYCSCTGCRSVSESCSRSRGSCIDRSLEQLPRTSLTTVAFCWTLLVVHRGPITMACWSCLCRQHNKLGYSSFSAASPRLWNDLTPELRRPGLFFDSFRHALKYHLFGDWSA